MANRETIIYGGKKYHRYPNSPRKHLQAYFWRHDKWKKPPFPLHRQIWIDNFGEIPKSHSIHHKNHNTLDNSIENLELLSCKLHASNHMRERRETKKGICEYKKCGKEFIYHSIRKAKYCSYKCYSMVRHGT